MNSMRLGVTANSTLVMAGLVIQPPNLKVTIPPPYLDIDE